MPHRCRRRQNALRRDRLIPTEAEAHYGYACSSSHSCWRLDVRRAGDRSDGSEEARRTLEYLSSATPATPMVPCESGRSSAGAVVRTACMARNAPLSNPRAEEETGVASSHQERRVRRRIRHPARLRRHKCDRQPKGQHQKSHSLRGTDIASLAAASARMRYETSRALRAIVPMHARTKLSRTLARSHARKARTLARTQARTLTRTHASCHAHWF